MNTLKCYIDPFAEKQMIQDIFTKEEHWVLTEDLCDKLYDICSEKGYKKVSLEGAYIEGLELMNKFKTVYPNSGINFYTI